jgi:hypothetical protein
MIDTNINWLLALGSTLLQAALGMVWFGPPIFGALWGKIMNMDMSKLAKMSKEEKDKMNKEMGPLYMMQTIATFVATATLLILIKLLPQVNPYVLTSVLWLGFVFTSQVTTTVWSQTKPKYMVVQVAVSSGYQLICMLLLAFLTTVFG